MGSEPTHAEVSRALRALRRAAGAASNVHNIAGLEALTNLPDAVTTWPDEARTSDRSAFVKLRLRADSQRLTDPELRRVAQMMLAQGSAPYADQALGIGERREVYVRHPDTETMNVDTLRTRTEREAADHLATLLLERLVDEPAADSSARLFNEQGVTGLTLNFYRDVPWRELIVGAESIDIMFTYGRTWRRSLTTEFNLLRERQVRPQFRIVLPDYLPGRDGALSDIAQRAGQSVEILTSNIEEADAFFTEFGAKIFYYEGTYLYAMYRFDDLIVATMYNHQRGQTSGVPTISCERGGSFFDFFMHDFEEVVTNRSLSRTSPIPNSSNTC